VISGALGAGLALFSRYPIIGASVHPYSLNGSPLDVGGGDWFVGKAATSIVVRHPLLGELEVFNTHVSPIPHQVGFSY
jgi:sphingomyelin phosphodiesterase 2